MCDFEEVADLAFTGCFDVLAAKPFGQGVVVGYYFGFLEFAALCSLQKCALIYAKRFMEDTREVLQVLANHILWKVVVTDVVEHDVQIVPTQLRTTHFVNNGRYLLES